MANKKHDVIYIYCPTFVIKELNICVSNLTLGDGEEALHHIIYVVILQVRVVSDWCIITGLVPAEALRRVVPVGKDPC